MPGNAPKLSAGDAASYKRAGYTFNAKSSLWQKKLPNGKTLNKNPKTKQTFIS